MVFTGAADVDIPEEARPWAPPGPERDRREREAALLAGDAIVAVRYFHGDFEPQPWRFAGFDSVAHGVELDTRDGHTFGATWVIDRHDVGLSFRREPLRPRWLSGYTSVRVRNVRWEGLMALRIDEVRLHWWERGCHAATLRAGDRSVHLLLGGDGPDDNLEGQDDNVAVVFDDGVSERARLGPWMPGG